MICSIQPDGSVLFEEIDFVIAELIVAPFLNENLVSFVVHDYLAKHVFKKDPNALQDWKEYTAPELEFLLADARQLILNDLITLQKVESLEHLYTLKIPRAHRDAWIRTLSLIRIVLAKNSGLSSEALTTRKLSSLKEGEEELLFQMEVLGTLQQLLIEAEDCEM